MKRSASTADTAAAEKTRPTGAVAVVRDGPKLDKYGMVRCGYCHTCLYPKLKKACLTNKNRRLSQGLDLQPQPKAYSKVKGEKRIKLAGVGTIVITQATDDTKTKADSGIAEGEKPKKTWQRKWVLVPNLLQNGMMICNNNF